MKRYALLTLIFLAMVLAILFSSYKPAPAMSAVATPAAGVVSVAEVASAPQQDASLPVAVQTNPTTSIPEQVIPVTGSAQTPSQAATEAVVTADVLNMRVGPGMNHRIMRQLIVGQTVSLLGRSVNSEWIAIRLADGSEGWVYGSYLRHNTDLASLPVREAYGGPLPSSPQAQPASKPSGRYTLNVSIGYNQAQVTMAGFAAERDVTLRLVAPGQGLTMTVASTTTDAQGSASLTFDMPTNWPDGSAVTQSQLELQVLGLDGKVLGKAKIAYQSPW